MAFTRAGGDASIGRNQRELALQRLLDRKQNAQRCSLPGHNRGGEHGKIDGPFARTRSSLGVYGAD